MRPDGSPEAGDGAVRALILAGGEGRRLRPFTANFPKPLMPLGDRTILEIIVAQLRAHGIGQVSLAVNHLAPLIMAYFGDGSKFSVAIDYLQEAQPLGTAGPLGLLDPPEGTLLVMNGDVLTDLDYRGFVAEHRRRGAALTVATQSRKFEIELGVVLSDDSGRVTGFHEKPVSHHRVCIGIYAVEPAVRRFITPGQRLDMPDLILKLVAAGERVVVHDHAGTWLDIGRPDDLAQAQGLIVAGWPDAAAG